MQLHRRTLAIALALTSCSPAPAPSPPRTPPPVRAVLERPPSPIDVPFDGLVGTRGPMSLVYASPDGHATVFCQARFDTNQDGVLAVHYGMHGDTYGDALSLYLALGPGAGEPIDDFLAADRTGRWLLLVKDHRIVLVDSTSRTESILGDAPAAPREPFAGPMGAFDAKGERLFFLRPRPAGVDVVVRQLSDRRDSRVDVGAGKVYAARFLGDWLTVDVVEKDTNHNGTLDLPHVRTSLKTSTCPGRIASYGIYGMSGDEPVRHVVSTANETTKLLEPNARPLGGGLLWRLATGALVLEDAKGRVLPIADGDCDARAFAIDDDDGTMLLACAATDPSPVIHVDREGHARRLDWTLPRAATADLRHGAHRFLDGAVVDVRSGTRRALALEGATLLRRHVLAFDGDEVFLADPTLAKDVALTSGAERYAPIVDDGDRVAMTMPTGAEVLDLAKQTSLGRVDGQALALSTAGAVLVTSASRYDPNGLPHGPARWVAPHP